MGGCPNLSGQMLFAPHDPVMTGAAGAGVFPAKTVQILWDVAMDTNVVPAAGSFTITDQGVPEVPNAVVWGAGNRLDLGFVGQAGSGPSSVSLNNIDNNLRSAADLAVAAAPQTENFTS